VLGCDLAHRRPRFVHTGEFGELTLFAFEGLIGVQPHEHGVQEGQRTVRLLHAERPTRDLQRRAIGAVIGSNVLQPRQLDAERR
jgi:hypothetical protein